MPAYVTGTSELTKVTCKRNAEAYAGFTLISIQNFTLLSSLKLFRPFSYNGYAPPDVHAPHVHDLPGLVLHAIEVELESFYSSCKD